MSSGVTIATLDRVGDLTVLTVGEIYRDHRRLALLCVEVFGRHWIVIKVLGIRVLTRAHR